MKRKTQELKATEIITGARRKIAMRPWEEKALQGADAADSSGAPVFITDPRAEQFSITGALLLVARDSDWEELALTMNAVAKVCGAKTTVEDSTAQTVEVIWAWEDIPGRTVAQVHEMLGRAYTELKAGA